MLLAVSLVPKDEVVYIMLKGAFKEFLICTDKTIYIYKTGYMTGHMVGGGTFSMPLANVTNVSLDFHFATGYFAVSAGGLQNTQKNFWSNDPKNDPAKSPNTITVNSAVQPLFQHAVQMINGTLLPTAKNPHVTTVTPQDKITDPIDEVRKLKGLLDDGIITEEEFETKKKQLLGL